MNQVMTTAEQNDIDIYYQDTDSMHLKESDVSSICMCIWRGDKK